MLRLCVLFFGIVAGIAALSNPLSAQTPTVGPRSDRAKPGSMIIDSKTFVVQGDEFYLDLRHGVLKDLPKNDGVDLSGYDLEFTFEGGSGRLAQLWFKNKDWKNVYSKAETIVPGRVIRFNPLDGGAVVDFTDFTHIYAIGAKVFKGVGGVEIKLVRLIRR